MHKISILLLGTFLCSYYTHCDAAVLLQKDQDTGLKNIVEEISGKCETAKEGPPGPPGPQGIQGPRGPVGPPGPAGPMRQSLDGLFTYNDNGGTPNTVPAGSPVPFNQAPIIQGSSITLTANTTLTFAATGDYYVSFTGTISNTQPTNNFVQFQLNIPGTGLVFYGTTASALSLGDNIALDGIVPITVPGTTLTVMVRTSSIIFAGGTSAEISVLQLSTP